MATAAVAAPSSAPTYDPETLQSFTKPKATGPQDVETILNYHKPNEDGSPPHPTYVDRPETYERPVDPQHVTVRDVRGRENDFTLDKNGFQFYRNTANEKDFLDDEKIKSGYYAEVEQLLKDAYAFINSFWSFFFTSIMYADVLHQHRRIPHLHLRPHDPTRIR
jgi:hypothetical protein